MKYHIISTSRAGHGAIFTNLKEATDYMKLRTGSTYSMSKKMPSRISPIEISQKIPDIEPDIEPDIKPDIKPDKSISTTCDIIIYTDGACSGNPGPAGSGVAIMQDGTTIHEISKSLGHATNNIAELAAIKLALEYLTAHKNMPMTLYTDSTYCIGVLTKNWKAKANVELIAFIKALLVPFKKLSIKHVKGHNGDFGNELADKLAVRGSQA